MLHPQLETFISYAKEQGVECSFFTNGVDLLGRPFSRDYWKKLKKAGLNQVDFSAHKLQEGEFREITKDIIRTNRVFDPKKDILWTWAGQTGEPQKPSMEKCIFEKKNAFVVLWDGTISSCCLDVEGQRSECHINDVLEKKTYAFEGINLCNSCASMREDENL